jgi:starch synthase (maltosyl-transferring)
MSWRNDPAPLPGAAFAAIVVECVAPAVDGGRYPAKRVVGDEARIGADIFKDGHDQLAAQVLYCGPGGSSWRAAPMAYVFDDDRWYGTVRLDQLGMWRFTVEAWVDRFGT